MSWTRIFALGALLVLPGAHGMPRRSQACKNIPGDPGWPSSSDWGSLNKTVDGRLLSTQQLATVCHGTEYDEEQCQSLKEAWPFADVHVAQAAEFLMPYKQNQSCDPFTAIDRPCELGNYAQYSIDVSSVEDIQAGIRFAKEKNIRLTIKNTGHDLLGKSTGKGSLSLWTHGLNTIDFIDHYNGSSCYKGPAVKIGAGVLTSDAVEAASSKGYRVVTGTCPDVGIAGGYTSGGGHSVFTSVYGMAADNVLEWEVITAEGEHLIATPTENADLYWALSGGGAGTFAAVVSMTTRLHPDGAMAGASLAFDAEMAGGVENFFKALATFQSALGPVVDAGAVASYAVVPYAVSVYGIAIPNGNASSIEKVLSPVRNAMAELGIELNITTTMHSHYLDFYNSYFAEATSTTPAAQITGGRLFPRDLLESSSGATDIAQAFQKAVDGGFAIVCDAINANQRHPHANSVFPVWRSSLLHCIFVKTWDWSMPWADMTAFQKNLTEVVMPEIESVTPGGGAYLNEANFQQADWENEFYGDNYPRLKGIKTKVDPAGIFYSSTAVGSDLWEEDSSGRLCQL